MSFEISFMAIGPSIVSLCCQSTKKELGKELGTELGALGAPFYRIPRLYGLALKANRDLNSAFHLPGITIKEMKSLIQRMASLTSRAH